MNEIKVSINRNGLLSKKSLSKYLTTDTIDFNKHVHDIDIFINDKWRKYTGGNIGRLFKITRRLELRFWPMRKRSRPSQGDFFALQREPCYKCSQYQLIFMKFKNQRQLDCSHASFTIYGYIIIYEFLNNNSRMNSSASDLNLFYCS